jgi:CRP-like cAMP-binding protein
MVGVDDVAVAGEPPSLRYLTADDRRLLFERAQQAHFVRDDVILAEGSRRQAIFFLRHGFVRVERAHLGHGIAVARRGPGEIFGEMSFLEGSGATASVVADQTVDVSVIDSADVYALLSSVPGFATRFYQSLALTLARRLEEMTSLLPPLIVEDVPQVKRFGAERSGRAGYAQIPPSLMDAVELFKTAMLEVDRGLKNLKLQDEPAQTRVTAACDGLEKTLREHIQRDGNLERDRSIRVQRDVPLLYAQPVQ